MISLLVTDYHQPDELVIGNLMVPLVTALSPLITALTYGHDQYVSICICSVYACVSIKARL